jgi:hypothetical protein
MTDSFCKNCKKKVIEHAKGMCVTCYKKLIWKPKSVICKRCERSKPMHAKGLCNGCYNSVFHIEKVKLHNAKRYHNLDFETYKNATKLCVVCGFDKIVDLHHLDMDHKNNKISNLTGLCPNHHKMAHHREHQKEVFNLLKEKGFRVPVGYKDDNLFKTPSS